MSKKIRLLLAFFALVLCLCNVVAYAALSDNKEDSTSRYYSQYFGKDVVPSVSGSESNINYAAGSVTTSVIDVSLPGKNGHDFNVVRKFNSQQTDRIIYLDIDYSQTKEYVKYKGYYYNYEFNGITYTTLVGFNSEAEMVDEFYVSKTKKQIDAMVNVDDNDTEYHIFDKLEDSDGETLFTRDKDFAMVEIVDYRCPDLLKKTPPNANIQIGNGWEIAVPSLCLTSEGTVFSNIPYFNGYFQDEYGKVIQFTYDSRLADDNNNYEVYSSTLKSNDYTMTIREEQTEASTPHSINFKSYIEIKDPYGKTYYFETENMGCGLFDELVVTKITDRYGNTITYHSRSHVTDTLGREIYMSGSGITVYSDNKRIKDIDYSIESEFDEERDPDHLLEFLKTYKLSVKKYTNSDEYEETVYTMKEKDINADNNFIIQNTLESIEYPTGLKETFSYESIATYGIMALYRRTSWQDRSDYYLYKVIKKSDFEMENNEYALKKTDDITYEVEGKDNIHWLDDLYATAIVNTSYTDGEDVKTEYFYDYFDREYGKNIWYGSKSIRYKNYYADDKNAEEPKNVSQRSAWKYSLKKPRAVGKEYYSTSTTRAAGLEYTQYKYDDRDRVIYVKNGNTYQDLVRDENYGIILTQLEEKDDNTKIKTVNTLTEDGLSIANTSVYEVKGETETLCSSVDYTYNADGTVNTEKINNGDESITKQYTYNYSLDNASYSVSVQTAATDADGVNSVITETIYYDAAGNTAKTEDGNGNVTEYTYDWLGRKIVHKNADGTQRNIDYNELNIITLTDEKDYKITYDYNSKGDIEKIFLPDDNNKLLLKTEYDSKYRITKEYTYKDDTNYVLTEYTYDFLDRLLKKTLKNNSEIFDEITYEYSFGNEVKFAEDDTVNISLNGLYDKIILFADGEKWNESLAWLSVKADGEEIFGNYVERDHIEYTTLDISGKDELEISVANRVNLNYMLLKEEEAGNGSLGSRNIVEVSYMRDSNYNRPDEKHIYDSVGRIMTSEYYKPYTSTLLNKEIYRYDYKGNVTEVNGGRMYMENLGSYVTKAEYDYAGRVVKQYNAEGGYLTKKYDMAGRMIESTDESRRKTTYTYDNLGRVIKIESPFGYGETTEKLLYYDGAGNVIKEKQLIDDTDGVKKYNITEYEYDEMNRPLWEKVNDGTRDIYSRYEYNEKGEMTEAVTGMLTKTAEGVPDESKYRGYGYDRFSNLTWLYEGTGNDIIYETNGFIMYEYNLVGEKVVERKRDGHKINYTYDAAGNVIKIENQDEEDDIIITYNKINKPVSIQKGTDKISYKYDELGFLTEERENGIVKTYENDTDGNIIMSRINGKRTEYEYDKMNRLKEVVFDYLQKVSYTYNAKGELTKEVNGSNTTNYGYNYAGLLTTKSTKNGSNVKTNYTMTYRKDGNLIKRVDGEEEKNYEYNNIGQLTKEDGIAYEYDTRGNRIKKVEGEEVTEYKYDYLDQLITEKQGDKVTAYGYDLYGNNTIKESYMLNTENGVIKQEETGETEYRTYDGYNRLKTLTRYGGEEEINAEYTYGADGKRTQKTVNGVVTKYIWDGDNILMETNGAGTVTAEYNRGIGLVSIKTGNKKYQYITDEHGNVDTIANASGETVNEYVYDAFGNEQISEEEIYNPYKYCGEYVDEESGLIYLRNRYYDPKMGRFITEDPIQSGVNWYVYANSNPVMYIDPWGLAEGDLFLGDTIIDKRYYREYDSGAYASSRDLISGYSGWIEKSQIGNGYVFAVGNSVFLVNLGSVKNEQLGMTNATNMYSGKKTGEIRYTLTDDLDNNGAVKILLNINDLSDLAYKEGVSKDYYWEMGERGGTHRHGDYINGGVSVYVPTNKVREVLNINSIADGIGSLNGANTTSFKDAFGDFIAGFIASEVKKVNLKRQIERNPPYINIGMTTTLGNTDGPYTAAYESKYIFCLPSNIGNFYPGVYDTF